MRPLFDKNARVVNRNTDSLFYEIATDDILEGLFAVEAYIRAEWTHQQSSLT